MASRIAHSIALQTKKPGGGFMGAFVSMLFLRLKKLENTCFNLLESDPEDQILCVGFNRAAGLECALAKRKGAGKVYGIDHAELMYELANEKFQENIINNELSLLCESVERISLQDNSIDRVFHTNCHVFWNDLDKSCDELYRVLKPGGIMVSLARYDRLRLQRKFGLLESDAVSPGFYIGAMLKSGFVDIRVKDVEISHRFSKAKAIFAVKQPSLVRSRTQFR